jgi:hypothetical protein
MDRRELGKMIGALTQPRQIKLLVKENLYIAIGIAAAVSKHVTPESAWVAVASVLELEEEEPSSPASIVLLCYFRKYVFNLYVEVMYLVMDRSRLDDEEGKRALQAKRLMRIIAERARAQAAEEDQLNHFKKVATEQTKTHWENVNLALQKKRTKLSFE